MSTCRPIREMTVEQESRNRGGCRYGLQDVRVKVPGYRGEFYIRSADWDARGRLELVLNSEPEAEKDDPEEWFKVMGLCEFLDADFEAPRLILRSMAGVKVAAPPDDLPLRDDADEIDPPTGDVEAPAAGCYLRSFWPVVVGRPSRWNEFNSKDRARAAGVPIPGERRATRVGGRR